MKVFQRMTVGTRLLGHAQVVEAALPLVTRQSLQSAIMDEAARIHGGISAGCALVRGRLDEEVRKVASGRRDAALKSAFLTVKWEVEAAQAQVLAVLEELRRSPPCAVEAPGQRAARLAVLAQAISTGEKLDAFLGSLAAAPPSPAGRESQAAARTAALRAVFFDLAALLIIVGLIVAIGVTTLHEKGPAGLTDFRSASAPAVGLGLSAMALFVAGKTVVDVGSLCAAAKARQPAAAPTAGASVEAPAVGGEASGHASLSEIRVHCSVLGRRQLFRHLLELGIRHDNTQFQALAVAACCAMKPENDDGSALVAEALDFVFETDILDAARCRRADLAKILVGVLFKAAGGQDAIGKDSRALLASARNKLRAIATRIGEARAGLGAAARSPDAGAILHEQTASERSLRDLEQYLDGLDGR